MKHKVLTSNDNGYDQPRYELRPFLGQRRLFTAEFQYSRRVPGGYGHGFLNARFKNVYDLVTNSPICVRGSTTVDHIWVEQVDWPNDIVRISELNEGEKISFTGDVCQYPNRGKACTDCCVKRVHDPMFWERYDKNMDILAEYEAGCPDVYDYPPEYSTFIPGLGNSQNPNSDDSEIPMNH